MTIERTPTETGFYCPKCSNGKELVFGNEYFCDQCNYMNNCSAGWVPLGVHDEAYKLEDI